MSTDGYFLLRQRAKEAKKAIRRARNFEHSGAEAEEVESFFWDMIENLSEHQAGEVEEARAWIIRMLGVIVECEARESYEPSLVAARGARVFLTVCACGRLRASFRPILSGVSRSRGRYGDQQIGSKSYGRAHSSKFNYGFPNPDLRSLRPFRS